VVYFLRAVYNLLLFNFRADNIEPVCEEFANVFLEEVYTLFEFEGLFEFYDDLVQGIEVVAVVAASTGEVHDGQYFLFSGLVGDADAFLPLCEDGFHSAAGLGFED
jgi:hypothetical protein